MPELDHLIFASADLEAGVRHIADLTGAEAVAGGPHPGIGTHNALLTFDERTYFEIIAIDPDQPEPSRPRPFGLDNGNPPNLAGYAVHPVDDETIEEIAATRRNAGFDPGPVLSMSRVKPDGSELHWRLTINDAGKPDDAMLPFVIDWGSTPSPATTLPSMGSLDQVTVAHPDPALRAAVEALSVGVTVVEGPAKLTATIVTPNGVVELR
ncbi:MAG: VOC family protein [Actinomycetota bacterium]